MLVEKDSEATPKEADCTDMPLKQVPDQMNNSTMDSLSSTEEMQYMYAEHGITLVTNKSPPQEELPYMYTSCYNIIVR
jgi:hypothetical protein